VRIQLVVERTQLGVHEPECMREAYGIGGNQWHIDALRKRERINVPALCSSRSRQSTLGRRKCALAS
jgi:hypothetical protein